MPHSENISHSLSKIVILSTGIFNKLMCCSSIVSVSVGVLFVIWTQTLIRKQVIWNIKFIPEFVIEQI